MNTYGEVTDEDGAELFIHSMLLEKNLAMMFMVAIICCGCSIGGFAEPQPIVK